MELFTIKNMSFNYGLHTVFRALNCSISSGMFYGLIGPNGSGKSTFIDILMGISKPDRGEVLFGNIPVASIAKRELAKKLSLVPQSVAMGFDFSVYEIVLMGRHPHIARFAAPTTIDFDLVESALQQLDIHHLRNRPATNLSGGEKQRVAVARALAQDTPVMLLDEATSNLDIRHSLEIMRVLKKRVTNEGSTIIAAVHDLNLAAAFCDKLIVLKDKNIHSEGETNTILNTEMIEEVFSVEASVVPSADHIRIEYQMLQPRQPQP